MLYNIDMNNYLTPAGQSSRDKILAYVKAYWLENKVSPSAREIQLACGISSTSVVDYHLRIMQREGVLYTHKKGQTRSIVPVGITISFQ